MSDQPKPSIGSNWGLAEERQFMENLVCQRFNFLLVFFTLVVGGAIACEEQLHLKIILWLGTIIILPMTLTIIGAHWKLEQILKRIFEEENHAITVIHRAGRGYSVRWMIGYLIPAFCAVVLILGAFLASNGVLQVKGKTTQAAPPALSDSSSIR